MCAHFTECNNKIQRATENQRVRERAQLFLSPAMAVGGAQKADDFHPHPVKDQLPGVDFCMTSSPPWRNSLRHPFL